MYFAIISPFQCTSPVSLTRQTVAGTNDNTVDHPAAVAPDYTSCHTALEVEFISRYAEQ
jgi:hypothetical protein